MKMRGKILIADARNYLGSVYRSVFADTDCGIVEYTSRFSEALLKLQASEFDLVIVDARFGDKGCMEFYSRAVELCPCLRQRFLFFSLDEMSINRLVFKDDKCFTKAVNRRDIKMLVYSIAGSGAGSA